MADWQPITFTPPTIPTAPTVPVVNAATQGQEATLRAQLDPTNPAYIGNKYLPELQSAGRNLQSNLDGFGYKFSDAGNGLLNPEKDAGTGQPARVYKDAYFGARSQAAASGMLDSQTAEQSVGTAWHRLTQQEQGFLNQYSAQANEILQREATDFTGVTSQLQGLYGQDIQYAIDNPIIAPDPTPAAAAAPAAAGPTVGAGVASRTWHGTVDPKLATLSRVWGVPISQIKVEHRDGQYVAYAK